MKNRREILELYDVTMANPNGDPLNDDAPRVDDDGICNVTDVRRKRVIRDTINTNRLVLKGIVPESEWDKYNVYLVEVDTENGKATKENLLAQYNNSYVDLFERCVDARLFGSVFTISKNDRKNGKGKKEESPEGSDEASSMSFTGAVQFNFGRSLHPVRILTIKGTTVTASKEGNQQGTITERKVIKYGLIGFHGIANENASIYRVPDKDGTVREIELTDKDIDVMLKAMWVGIKASNNVITHSKIGHEPRLLMEIVYHEGVLTHMGDLLRLIRVNTEKPIEDIFDVKFDLTLLEKKVKRHWDKIKEVRYIMSDLVEDKLDGKLKEIFGDKLKPFEWSKDV